MKTFIPEMSHTVSMVRIFGTIIIVVGTIGNLLSIFTLSRRTMRTQPTACFLLALAISDLGVIYSVYFSHYLKVGFDIKIRHSNTFVCKLTVYLGYLFLQLSPSLLAAVSVQRLFCIKYATKWSKLCTLNAARTVICLLYLLAILDNLHFLYFYELQTGAGGTVNYCGVLHSTAYYT
ncbi:hypothetical protein GJ496_004489, partial [Pomphorhynchus laevis]